MNVVASYLLLKLAGKTPDAASISSVISAAGAEADAAQVELLLKELEGKDVDELIKDGKEKLKSVSLGGGGGGGGVAAAPAAGGAAPADAGKKVSQFLYMRNNTIYMWREREWCLYMCVYTYLAARVDCGEGACVCQCLFLMSPFINYSHSHIHLYPSTYIYQQEKKEEKEEEADLGAGNMFGGGEGY